ncbi:class I SAM-dependent methyltransferase [Aeromicrobium sp. YIM 150415]|uniref:class I SAM-dependent DNA methyltransferase n=1 Tax=Aeromicrobium sp. YIM 150415 TaxID=2803912 RepID=UPI001F052910|nr:class I SAM-dependent methyltransferase [Aeromicrobium sp. YIM 150415]
MNDTHPILARLYALKDADEAREVYDAWAADYDHDTVDDMGYVAPALAAEALAERISDGATVLDAGCGTGLVGAELSQRREVALDGMDLSPGMLERARAREVYRTLETADLTRELAVTDDAYDAVICVGTLTGGHVGPGVLAEFVRITAPGGAIVATVHSHVWEDGGYRAEIERLAGEGLVSAEVWERPYHVREQMSCRLCVLTPQ